MKTILVATNYSSDSDNAIKYAAALAKHTGSKLVLLNCFELSVHAVNTLFPASVIQELMSENRKRLKDVAFNVSNIFGVPVESLTRNTNLQDELNSQVERLNADLVVMGMGETCSGPQHGNITTTIIHHAKYPVLAVPREACFEGITNILFAFDPSGMNAANKLSLLMEVASHFKAQVQVYHVNQSRETAIANKHAVNSDITVESLLHNVDHASVNIFDDDVIKGIEGGINEYKAELLVMAPHKYGFWQSVWHKSKTSKMARRTHIPLLALPDPTIL